MHAELARPDDSRTRRHRIPAAAGPPTGYHGEFPLRPQIQECIRPHPAILGTARRHIRPHQATSGHRGYNQQCEYLPHHNQRWATLTS